MPTRRTRHPTEPQTIRNFWLNAYVDGRETTLQGGPKYPDGGMQVYLQMRDHGGVRTFSIEGQVDGDVLTLEFYEWGQDEEPVLIQHYSTRR